MNEIYTELYEKLARLQWLMQRSHLQSHYAHGPMGDPTRGQGRVLAMLKIQPEISAKDLSYLLGIRQQSLNELLNKLEKNGYITRTQSDADKRVMMIRLTEQGKNVRPEERDFGGIFGCLSEEEQQTFGEYLDRIIAAMEATLTDDNDSAGNWERGARERFGDEWLERMRSVRGRNGFDERNGCSRGGDRHGPDHCRSDCHRPQAVENSPHGNGKNEENNG